MIRCETLKVLNNSFLRSLSTVGGGGTGFGLTGSVAEVTKSGLVVLGLPDSFTKGSAGLADTGALFSAFALLPDVAGFVGAA